MRSRSPLLLAGLALAAAVVLLLARAAATPQLPPGATGGVEVTYERPTGTPGISVSPSPTATTRLTISPTVTLPGRELEYVAAHLELRVDRERYGPGDRVVITLVNRGDEPVELTDPPWAVYRLVGSRWVEVYAPTPRAAATATATVTLPKTPPKTETVTVTAATTVTIGPGGSASWTWDLRVGGEPVAPGRYAVALRRPIDVGVGGGPLVRLSFPPRYGPVAYFTVEAPVGLLPEVVRVSLRVDAPEGSAEFAGVATLLVAERSCVLFEARAEAEGLGSVVLSGELLLESEDASYRVSMPCLLAVGAECYRVMVLIPGYDVPMPVEPGRYRVTLRLSWGEASGEGGLTVELRARRVGAPELVALPGERPPDTAGWVTAEGSTRSFALLVDRTSAEAGPCGYAEFTAYAWQFAPHEEGPAEFRARLVDAGTGEVLAEVAERVEKEPAGLAAYRLVLLVRAGPGSYVLAVELPNGRELSVDLEVR